MEKVAIVGYGNVAAVHAAAICGIGQAMLYGACDIVPEKLEQFQKKYGGKVFLDFDEMLKDKNIDIVHICTPHYLHYEMAKKAVLSGKKVVLEKPATMNGEEFEKLYTDFKNAPICVMFQNRLNSCILKMKEIIENEDLGAFECAKGIVTWSRDHHYYDRDLWRGTLKYEGGGVLINQAIHTLDLINYLTGGIESVCATTHNHTIPEYSEIEDTVEATLKFTQGGQGLFYASNAYGVNSGVMVELVFEKETLLYLNGRLIRNDEIIAKDEVPQKGKNYWGTAHSCVLEEFYQGKNNFNLNNIKNTMRSVFAIYESAKQNGKEIKICDL